MALVTNTGSMAKVKAYHVSLSGWTGNGTSQFGNSSDINCTDVEYISLEKPQKSENESTEIQTNLRTFKDDVPNQGWEDFDGLEMWADAGGVNWRACVAAQECDSTGTLTITSINGTSTTVLGSWKAKVSQAGGGGGDASGFDTSFTPTFRLLEYAGTGTATA